MLTSLSMCCRSPSSQDCRQEGGWRKERLQGKAPKGSREGSEGQESSAPGSPQQEEQEIQALSSLQETQDPVPPQGSKIPQEERLQSVQVSRRDGVSRSVCYCRTQIVNF